MREQINLRSIKLSNDILLGAVVEMVKKGSVVKINISGSSMQPFLYDGDSVLLQNVILGDIKFGDIILGKYKDSYVLHRAVFKNSGFVYLAGDNNLSQIEKIEAGSIYAKAVALVKNSENKNLTSVISRGLGLLWFVLRPLRSVILKVKKK